jgi:hypothetical protein
MMNKNSFRQWLRALWNTMKDRELMRWFTEQTATSIRAIFSQPKDNFDHGNNAPTILLTSGFLCNNGAMKALGAELNQRYNVAYAPHTSLRNTWDIKTSAHALSNKVKNILQHNEKNNDISVLWHSLWGIIATKALLDSWDLRLNKLITCATPWEWAPIASMVPFFTAAKQMNQSWWYFGPDDNMDDFTISVENYVSDRDVFVPPSRQYMPLSISTQASNTIMGWYTHTDFLSWKHQKFANHIKI